MLAAVLRGVGELAMQRRPRPVRPAGGLLVRVAACGVCASDVKMWRRGHPGLRLPRVLGHEVTGWVAAAAPSSGLRPGQAVQVAPGMACGRCPACQAGRHNLCPGVKVLGFSLDGGWAGYLAVPAAGLAVGAVNPLPPGLEPVTATLAEPLACALNALEVAELRPGQPVAVFGAGVVGRLAAWAAQRLGAGRVLLVETDPARLRHLPVAGLDASAGFDPAAARQRLGGQAQVVIPACPDPRAVEWGAELLGPGGTLVLFSGLAARPELDLNQVHYRQLRLVGAYGCTSGQNRRALALLAADPQTPAAWISHRLPLEQAEPGLRLAAGRALKVILIPSKE